METQSDYAYAGIKHVVYVHTGIGTRCDECNELINGEEFAETVNHYLDQHGYKLLHVGSETSFGPDGRQLWHNTVAVLGK